MDVETIKRIIKDYKLPIPLIPEYYDYFFNLYEDILHSNTIKKQLENEILKSGLTESEYLEKLHFEKNQLIETISNSEAFQIFNSESNPDFFGNSAKFQNTTSVFPFTRNSDVYQISNIGKKFISIDLEKANFQVCKLYDTKLVLESENYSELIKKFVNSEYLTGSKHVRQIIFGNLAPKRQNIMEKYYTGKILSFLIEKKFFNEHDIRVFTHDEIVLNAEKFLTEEESQNIYNAIFTEFGLKVHVDSFTMHEVLNKYFVKETSIGEISFKGIPVHHFAQAYKRYLKKEIEQKDLVFLYKGEICFFKKALE